MFLHKVLVLLCSVLAAQALVIEVKACDGTTPVPTQVDLSPCTQMPCTFKKGSTVDVKIDFTASTPTDALSAKVWGYVAGIPVPFPLPNGDACKNSNIQCPVTQGTSYNYHASFPVLPEYPKINVVVMWKLQGLNGDETCFTFPMSIVE